MNKEILNNLPLIAIITPIAIAFVIGLFKNKYMKLKKIFVIVALLVSVIAVILMIKPVMFNNDTITVWLGNWKPLAGKAFGIALEVDALGIFMALIISIACLLSAIYSLKYMSKDNGLDKYYALFLLLSGSMLGFVFTGDLFNMYVMLEIMTFAAISLTAFRNYKDKSLEAAFKYIVTGSLGSSLILLGTVLLYTETKTLNLAEIIDILRNTSEVSSITILAFSSMMVGYAVKAFMVPCHTWPTDAHMAAPSSISMILSGVMSKTGIYAVIRILFGIFALNDNKYVGYIIIVWGIATMIVGVTMALLQHDFKRLLAFHSVSQIGYIVSAFGVAIICTGKIQDLAMAGALYHMINHAVFKGLLFLCAGAVLYTTGTTDLNSISGLGKKMPFTMTMFLFGAAAISGIPPFNGFASKWIIYESASQGKVEIVTVVAVVVSAMTLASFIKVGHSVFFGPENIGGGQIKEVPFSMKVPMSVLSIGTLVLGLFPRVMMKYILSPVISCILNIDSYINAALNIGTSESIDTTIKISGIYSPGNFFILFIVVLLAIFIFMLFNMKYSIDEDKYLSEAYINRGSRKFDVFLGGENEEATKVNSGDLFWPMKHELKGYFKFIENAHNGSVNTYSLWIVTMLIVVTILSFIFL